MSRLFAAIAAATLLTASSAHADLLAPGHKSVASSIRVSAEPPADRVLILANTFEGLTVLEPDQVTKVSWHPLSGNMQLVLAKRSDLKTLQEIKPGPERLEKIRQLTVDCSKPFKGVRTIREQEPYDEVRWHYQVSIESDGKACTAKLTRTVQLKDGQALAPAASATASASATPVATSATATSRAPNAKAPATQQASGGCGGCSLERSSSPQGPVTTLVLLGLLVRRRRPGR